MTEPDTVLPAARDACARRDWPAARAAFEVADGVTALTADDLSAWAEAAWWLGRDEESAAVGERAYRRHVDAGAPRKAAMEALGLAYDAFLHGAEALGSGWIGRAQRLVADQPECPEQGYVRYVQEVEAALDAPEGDVVIEAAREVRELGWRQRDPTLVAAGTLAEGRLLVRRGRVREGLRLLDEAMLAVVSEALPPIWAGNLYCHMMAACHELCDIARAREWTEATTRWLASLPAAVLFTGICRVHRSQVLQTSGAWDRAESEAARACADGAQLDVALAGEAHYQLGELRRLRGDLDDAEQAYLRAHEHGRDPQPGLALTQLARGEVTAAATGIRAALLAASGEPLARARLCCAQVEIELAAGDVPAATKASDELDETAASYASSGLQAMAQQARAAVTFADGHPAEALPLLRAACRCWQELSAPYDAARVRVLLGQAYRAVGDAEAAGRELAVAQAVFSRLGARRDLAHAAALAGTPTRTDGLTAREVEVLVLVAGGRTNRSVAEALVLSEKTVARHLSNIFTKLGLSSRTQAAAYAFSQGLMGPAADGG